MKPAVARLLDRRGFFKSMGAAAGGAVAAGLTGTADARAEAAAALVQSNVKRASEPSALKITDLRVAVVEKAPMTCPLIRIDTNQGIAGYGEVRDGASETYALFLKSRLLGENPCHVDKVFRKIKQFGGPARQAGGVCGIEMALHGPRGQGVGRTRLADARRPLSRSCAALCGHDGDGRSQGAGRTAEGPHGSRHQLPQAGFRHQPAARQAGHAEQAGGTDVQREPVDHASVHRDRNHRQGRRVPVRLDRGDSRSDRAGGAACLRSLRPHRRQ